MTTSIDRTTGARITGAVAAAMAAARASFEDLAANTRGSAGIARAPYGEGEQYAYRRLGERAGSLGLESAWDPAGNLYMALGLIAPGELDTAIRLDSGRSLGEHIADCGFDPARVRSGPRYLDARCIRSYFERHIEQGPVLEMKGLPVGMVNSIRGNSRLRGARCVGAYNHGGATPQEVRRDAVIATSELVLGVDGKWSELHAAGADLIFTFGKVSTDPAVHSLSKVPGEMRFTLDIRSGSPDVLATMRAFVSEEAERVAAKRQVRFELGDFSVSQPTVLDASLCSTLHAGCAAVGAARPRDDERRRSRCPGARTWGHRLRR